MCLLLPHRRAFHSRHSRAQKCIKRISYICHNIMCASLWVGDWWCALFASTAIVCTLLLFIEIAEIRLPLTDLILLAAPLMMTIELVVGKLLMLWHQLEHASHLQTSGRMCESFVWFTTFRFYFLQIKRRHISRAFSPRYFLVLFPKVELKRLSCTQETSALLDGCCI